MSNRHLATGPQDADGSQQVRRLASRTDLAQKGRVCETDTVVGLSRILTFRCRAQTMPQAAATVWSRGGFAGREWPSPQVALGGRV